MTKQTKTEDEFNQDVTKLAQKFGEVVSAPLRVGTRKTNLFEHEVVVVDPFGGIVQVFGVWWNRHAGEAYYCHGPIIRRNGEKVVN